MISPQQRHDKLIRSTDLDALTCRLSTNNQHYYSPPDPYIEVLIKSYQSNLQHCIGYTNLSAGRTLRSLVSERKLPLINRGTYLRTRVIDLVIDEFAAEFGHCQVISLGSGSDTRCFLMLKKHPNLEYHEIDFPESIKVKKLAIVNNSELLDVIKYKGDVVAIGSREEFESFSLNLHTERYHLYGYDLRQLNENHPFVHKDIPTIVLSECVLCYLTEQENVDIINFWRDSVKSLVSFLIYEPMSLNDAFGTTMTKNLLRRGLELPTFDALPDLPSRKRFLEQCKLENVKVTNISDVGGYSGNVLKKPWFEMDEVRRINRLELIDEVEEIKLLFEHYCLCYGEFGGVFGGINKWRWLTN